MGVQNRLTIRIKKHKASAAIKKNQRKNPGTNLKKRLHNRRSAARGRD
jgi:hypothetical protein